MRSVETCEDHKVKMEVEVPHRMLSDVMIIAFDGAYGAVIQYGWADTGKYHIKRDPKDHADDWWEAVEIELNESNPVGAREQSFKVDWGVLVAGMQRILDDKEVRLDLRQTIAQAIMDDDAGEIDAPMADRIVQYGIFGKEVYS